MLRKTFIFLFVIIVHLAALADDKPAYVLYDSKGKQVAYQKMLKKLQGADVILFGELHNSPIAHWLQLELVKDLHAKGHKLVLGAEMLEADDQLILDEYLQGKILLSHLKSEAKVWNNFETDYQPLVTFAFENQLSFIATNIPRRYANLVYREGLEALHELSKQAKGYMAPLPVEVDTTLKTYKEMRQMSGAHGAKDGGLKFVYAQAIKDATMAHHIGKSIQPGSVFIHFNGSFHSNFKEGIYHYLSLANPGLKIITLSTVEQPQVDQLQDEFKEIADYIICVPETMTSTF
jgi:uncharacterized iron-regulated protein